MKSLTVTLIAASLLTLSACGQTSDSPEAIKARAEKIEAKAVSDLSKMEIPEIIDFLNDEADDLSALLKTVTDEASAEAAVADIRSSVPRFNAAFKSLDDIDPENMKMSIGTMRKMMSVAQSQSGLINEVVRIGQIPEARAVLEKEFDKIEITGN